MKSIIPSKERGSLFRQAKNELSKLRKRILRELSRCKESGKMVQITSPALDGGTVTSSVEDIYRNGSDEVVVLRWFDANNFVSRTHVFIDEIMAVRPIDKLKRSAM